MAAKRQSESVRAKSQQRYRRRRGLFKKAKEFLQECESDVFVAVRIRKDGQIYIFDSSTQNQWLKDLSNLVQTTRCTQSNDRRTNKERRSLSILVLSANQENPRKELNWQASNGPMPSTNRALRTSISCLITQYMYIINEERG